MLDWYTPDNPNGMTIEDVITETIKRLSLYNSKVPCSENVMALEALCIAKTHLENRTEDRIDRGVEGTMNP